MSEEKGSSIEKVVIYVRLMGEGTTVFRPTQGVPFGEGHYKLLPSDDYDPDDEIWEFLPGSVVSVEMQRLDGGVVMVAVGAK